MKKIEKLISELTLKEKIGQLSQNLFGWETYIDNGNKFTKKFNDELNRYGTIGTIYGIMRSDPWSKVDSSNGIPPNKSANILNKFQKTIMSKSKIPAFFSEEIPHGHQGIGGTNLPVNIAIGSTFNKELYKDACSFVATEVRSKGAHLGLISCLDLALDPRWGRTEECYGEDTYLSMEMTKSAVLGLQGDDPYNIPKNKLGAVVKHFIGQGSALGGHNGKTVSMGENELRAHHLPIMKAAIDAGALACMAAYNDIDGVPCHANEKLLKDILVDELGHKGFVMSDGCAIDNLVDYLERDDLSIATSLKAGVHMDLWNKTFNALEEAVKNKYITEKEIDSIVLKILESKNRMNLFDEPFTDEGLYEKINFKDGDELNLKAAEESLVLLENDGVLPLKNLDGACLIGNNADNVYHQLGDYTAFQDLDKVKSIKEVFNIPFEKGTNLRTINNEGIAKAVELAKKHKTVLLVIGSSSMRNFNTKFDDNGAAIIDEDYISDMDCGEGVDASEIELSESQLLLFDEVYKVNKNIIVIGVAGRPIGIEKIIKRSKAILWSWYSGAQGAQAIKNTLLGKNNPSGKLPITFPKNSAVIPVYHWMKETGQYVDEKNPVLYKFGHGMSYSKISSSIIGIKKLSETKYEIKISIFNDSNIDAKHSVLIYGTITKTKIKPPNSPLVGFDKYSLKPNQRIEIIINVDLKWLHDNFQFGNIEFKLNK